MKCPYCNAEISDDSLFCGNCGKKLPNKINPPSNFWKILVACMVACVLIGGGWYAGSHFFFKNEVFPTIDTFIALLQDIENEKRANACGLEKIYNVTVEEEEYTSIGIVYGKDVEKGSHKEYAGFEIKAKSDHSVYLEYRAETSSDASLFFKSKDDSDAFFKKAMDYGLLIIKDEYSDGDSYYIPKNKLPNGSKRIEKLEWGGEFDPIFPLAKPKYEDGWYVINIGMDF